MCVCCSRALGREITETTGNDRETGGKKDGEGDKDDKDNEEEEAKDEDDEFDWDEDDESHEPEEPKIHPYIEV